LNPERIRQILALIDNSRLERPGGLLHILSEILQVLKENRTVFQGHHNLLQDAEVRISDVYAPSLSDLLTSYISAMGHVHNGDDQWLRIAEMLGIKVYQGGAVAPPETFRVSVNDLTAPQLQEIVSYLSRIDGQLESSAISSAQDDLSKRIEAAHSSLRSKLIDDLYTAGDPSAQPLFTVSVRVGEGTVISTKLDISAILESLSSIKPIAGESSRVTIRYQPMGSAELYGRAMLHLEAAGGTGYRLRLRVPPGFPDAGKLVSVADYYARTGGDYYARTMGARELLQPLLDAGIPSREITSKAHEVLRWAADTSVGMEGSAEQLIKQVQDVVQVVRRERASLLPQLRSSWKKALEAIRSPYSETVSVSEILLSAPKRTVSIPGGEIPLREFVENYLQSLSSRQVARNFELQLNVVRESLQEVFASQSARIGITLPEDFVPQAAPKAFYEYLSAWQEVLENKSSAFVEALNAIAPPQAGEPSVVQYIADIIGRFAGISAVSKSTGVSSAHSTEIIHEIVLSQAFGELLKQSEWKLEQKHIDVLQKLEAVHVEAVQRATGALVSYIGEDIQAFLRLVGSKLPVSAEQFVSTLFEQVAQRMASEESGWLVASKASHVLGSHFAHLRSLLVSGRLTGGLERAARDLLAGSYESSLDRLVSEAVVHFLESLSVSSGGLKSVLELGGELVVSQEDIFEALRSTAAYLDTRYGFREDIVNYRREYILGKHYTTWRHLTYRDIVFGMLGPLQGSDFEEQASRTLAAEIISNIIGELSGATPADVDKPLSIASLERAGLVSYLDQVVETEDTDTKQAVRHQEQLAASAAAQWQEALEAPFEEIKRQYEETQLRRSFREHMEQSARQQTGGAVKFTTDTPQNIYTLSTGRTGRLQRRVDVAMKIKQWIERETGTAPRPPEYGRSISAFITRSGMLFYPEKLPEGIGSIQVEGTTVSLRDLLRTANVQVEDVNISIANNQLTFEKAIEMLRERWGGRTSDATASSEQASIPVSKLSEEQTKSILSALERVSERQIPASASKTQDEILGEIVEIILRPFGETPAERMADPRARLLLFGALPEEIDPKALSFAAEEARGLISQHVMSLVSAEEIVEDIASLVEARLRRPEERTGTNWVPTKQRTKMPLRVHTEVSDLISELYLKMVSLARELAPGTTYRGDTVPADPKGYVRFISRIAAQDLAESQAKKIIEQMINETPAEITTPEGETVNIIDQASVASRYQKSAEEEAIANIEQEQAARQAEEQAQVQGSLAQQKAEEQAAVAEQAAESVAEQAAEQASTAEQAGKAGKLEQPSEVLYNSYADELQSKIQQIKNELENLKSSRQKLRDDKQKLESELQQIASDIANLDKEKEELNKQLSVAAQSNEESKKQEIEARRKQIEAQRTEKLQRQQQLQSGKAQKESQIEDNSKAASKARAKLRELARKWRVISKTESRNTSPAPEYQPPHEYQPQQMIEDTFRVETREWRAFIQSHPDMDRAVDAIESIARDIAQAMAPAAESPETARIPISLNVRTDQGTLRIDIYPGGYAEVGGVRVSILPTTRKFNLEDIDPYAVRVQLFGAHIPSTANQILEANNLSLVRTRQGHELYSIVRNTAAENIQRILETDIQNIVSIDIEQDIQTRVIQEIGMVFQGGSRRYALPQVEASAAASAELNMLLEFGAGLNELFMDDQKRLVGYNIQQYDIPQLLSRLTYHIHRLEGGAYFVPTSEELRKIATSSQEAIQRLRETVDLLRELATGSEQQPARVIDVYPAAAYLLRDMPHVTLEDVAAELVKDFSGVETHRAIEDARLLLDVVQAIRRQAADENSDIARLVAEVSSEKLAHYDVKKHVLYGLGEVSLRVNESPYPLRLIRGRVFRFKGIYEDEGTYKALLEELRPSTRGEVARPVVLEAPSLQELEARLASAFAVAEESEALSWAEQRVRDRAMRNLRRLVQMDKGDVGLESLLARWARTNILTEIAASASTIRDVVSQAEHFASLTLSRALEGEEQAIQTFLKYLPVELRGVMSEQDIKTLIGRVYSYLRDPRFVTDPQLIEQWRMMRTAAQTIMNVTSPLLQQLIQEVRTGAISSYQAEAIFANLASTFLEEVSQQDEWRDILRYRLNPTLEQESTARIVVPVLEGTSIKLSTSVYHLSPIVSEQQQEYLAARAAERALKQMAQNNDPLLQLLLLSAEGESSMAEEVMKVRRLLRAVEQGQVDDALLKQVQNLIGTQEVPSAEDAAQILRKRHQELLSRVGSEITRRIQQLATGPEDNIRRLFRHYDPAVHRNLSQLVSEAAFSYAKQRRDWAPSARVSHRLIATIRELGEAVARMESEIPVLSSPTATDRPNYRGIEALNYLGFGQIGRDKLPKIKEQAKTALLERLQKQVPAAAEEYQRGRKQPEYVRQSRRKRGGRAQRRAGLRFGTPEYIARSMEQRARVLSALLETEREFQGSGRDASKILKRLEERLGAQFVIGNKVYRTGNVRDVMQAISRLVREASGATSQAGRRMPITISMSSKDLARLNNLQGILTSTFRAARNEAQAAAAIRNIFAPQPQAKVQAPPPGQSPPGTGQRTAGGATGKRKPGQKPTTQQKPPTSNIASKPTAAASITPPQPSTGGAARHIPSPGAMRAGASVVWPMLAMAALFVLPAVVHSSIQLDTSDDGASERMPMYIRDKVQQVQDVEERRRLLRYIDSRSELNAALSQMQRNMPMNLRVRGRDKRDYEIRDEIDAELARAFENRSGGGIL
jgi:hypothetical protein